MELAGGSRRDDGAPGNARGATRRVMTAPPFDIHPKGKPKVTPVPHSCRAESLIQLTDFVGNRSAWTIAYLPRTSPGFSMAMGLSMLLLLRAPGTWSGPWSALRLQRAFLPF